jgi:hypothetical protein
MRDIRDALARARQAYTKSSATTATGATRELDTNKIKELAEHKEVAQHIPDGATGATGSTSNPLREGATSHVLPEKIHDYNDLEDEVAQVAPVAPKNDSKVQKSDPRVAVSALKKLRLAIAETTGIRNRFASVNVVAETLTAALAAMQTVERRERN